MAETQTVNTAEADELKDLGEFIVGEHKLNEYIDLPTRSNAKCTNCNGKAQLNAYYVGRGYDVDWCLACLLSTQKEQMEPQEIRYCELLVKLNSP